MPKKISENDEIYGLYWEQFVEYLEGNKLKLRTNKKRPDPRPQYNYDINVAPKGVYGVCIALTLSTTKERRSVEIYLGNNKTKDALFKFLKEDKKAIEKALGLDLQWIKIPGTKRARIVHEEYNYQPEYERNWDECNKWFKETIEKFDHVFISRLENM